MTGPLSADAELVPDESAAGDIAPVVAPPRRFLNAAARVHLRSDGRRIVFCLLAAFGASAFSCSASTAEEAAEPDEPIPVVNLSESSLGRFGVSIPPMLYHEEQLGISNCFLPSAAADRAKDMQLELIRCNEEYAVFVGKDVVGALPQEDQHVERQPLSIYVSRADDAASPIPKMPFVSYDALDPSLRETLTQRFNLTETPSHCSYSAIGGPGKSIFGSAYVRCGAFLVDFTYSDMLRPKTRAFQITDNFVFILETNSINFVAVRGAMIRYMGIVR
jgi:hypothetical protein